MSYKPERIKDIYLYFHEYGLEATAKHFDIQQETVSRYCRRYKFKKENQRAPKILLLDIETLPMHFRAWRPGKQYLRVEQMVDGKDWVVLSWSAKWLCAPDIVSDILIPSEAIERDDGRICKSIYRLIDEADILIAHNLDRFDLPSLVSRFMIHGMKPFSPVQCIDTLKESRKVAKHSSHKLDWIGRLATNEGKLLTDFSLWVKCEHGNTEALARMLEYNKDDVRLLEETYLWMLPWIKSHPNIGLYQDSDGKACKRCGAPVKWVDKYQYTLVNRYDSFKCTRCGSYSRGRRTDITPSERSTILA